MFPSSTQRRFWTFENEAEITKLREQANNTYMKKRSRISKVVSDQFLSSSEERIITRHFEYALKEFCNHFQPPMPKYVIGTSMMYFKRFYLSNSVMDFHPKDIMLTCVYLGCKVEEFNVSILQFVKNLKSNREAAVDLILSYELLLMYHLNYHLTVHNPFRPLEGLFIDIKTRSTSLTVEDVEKCRRGAEDFLDRMIHTDCPLLFSPSQVALAAILSSANKQGINMERYVKEFLLQPSTNTQTSKTIEHIKKIRHLVKHQAQLDKSDFRRLAQKLEHCRNQENNPESEVFKRKQQDMLDVDEEVQSRKRMKKAEENRRTERELLGIDSV